MTAVPAPEGAITEDDPRPASMLQPVTFNDSTEDELAVPFAGIRGYRVMSDDEDPGVVLLGPCAYTIGCLFDRKFYDEDGVALGTLIDAAVEHEGVQGQRVHAHIAAMDAVMDAETGAAQSPAPVPAESEALSASVALPVPDDTGRELPGLDAPPRDRAGAVAELRRIADQDIGANAPWLAGRLHALADQLAAEMSGECQMTAGQVAHTACDTAVTGLQAERDEARAKLAAIRAYLDQHKGDAGLSLLHVGDLLAITGTGEEAGRG